MSPPFLSALKTPCKVILKYDVPYLTGVSKDRSTIYVDKSLKRFFKGKDVVQFLLTYEKAKIALIDIYGLDITQAHYIATHAIEVQAVSWAGLTWKDYESFLISQIKSPKMVKYIPPDLDLDLYDSEDKKKLQLKLKKPEEKNERRSIHKDGLSKLRQRKAASDFTGS